MLKSIRDSELGIGNFRLRTPRNEQLGGPSGLDNHGRGQACSGSLKASTVRWGGACMDSEEFSKVCLIEAWRAEALLCIT